MRCGARPPARLQASKLRCVKTHVANLLNKLGLRDRAQAIVYAYETGFIRPGAGTGNDGS